MPVCYFHTRVEGKPKCKQT